MTHIASFVFRTPHTEETLRFYRALGLHFEKEQHNSPIHFSSPLPKDAVVEIYRATEKLKEDTLVIYVQSIEAALLKLRDEGFVTTEEKSKDHSLIRDPDNRLILLFEALK